MANTALDSTEVAFTMEDAAEMITAEEKRCITLLRNVVADFVAELESISLSNRIPASFRSESRDLTANIRGMITMNVQQVNDAYARNYPITVPVAVPFETTAA